MKALSTSLLVRKEILAGGLRWLPMQGQGQGRQLSTTPPQEAVDGVRRGMQRWVDEFIVKEDICPFAKKSNYRFEIYPNSQLNRKTFEFFGRHARETAENQQETRQLNTFLVFPFVEAFQSNMTSFWDFHIHAVDQESDGHAITPQMEVQGKISSNKQQVVAMVFHPDFPEWSWAPGMPESRFYSAVAPFPAIHLLRLADLDVARGTAYSFTGPRISEKIAKQNDVTFPQIGVKELKRRITDYQSELLDSSHKTVPTTLLRAQPKTATTIQVVRPLPPKELERLRAEGIIVELLEPEVLLPAKPISLRGSKKKDKKKKKR